MLNGRLKKVSFGVILAVQFLFLLYFLFLFVLGILSMLGKEGMEEATMSVFIMLFNIQIVLTAVFVILSKLSYIPKGFAACALVLLGVFLLGQLIYLFNTQLTAYILPLYVLCICAALIYFVVLTVGLRKSKAAGQPIPNNH